MYNHTYMCVRVTSIYPRISKSPVRTSVEVHRLSELGGLIRKLSAARTNVLWRSHSVSRIDHAARAISADASTANGEFREYLSIPG